MSTESDRDRLHGLLNTLAERTGGPFRLAECHGKLNWPMRGVYFFYEHGEVRPDGTPRLTRIGTHALKSGGKATLWNRLGTHRGTIAGGGNHRGSIFRLHVGTGLLRRDDTLAPCNTWSVGNSAKKPITSREMHVEQAVSAHIGAMPFLVVNVDDEPGPTSDRAMIETGCIRLLSCIGSEPPTSDAPSPNWLGHHAASEKVRSSGLWNVKETKGPHDPQALDTLEHWVNETEPISPK
ncbi:MAG: hypothetical protein ACI89L_002612 [Phycisphaerales bacterium]|jgi:hypothetical protein